MSEIGDNALLKNYVSEGKQKRKEKYREEEKIVRDIQWGREQWVKRKREFFFFFTQVVSLSVNLYLI